MEEVFELELYSRPNQLLDQDFGKLISHDFGDLVLGLSNIPSKVDSDNLIIAIAEGEITEAEFNSFCIINNLESSVYNCESATKFLAFLYGTPIAWIHLPYDDYGLVMFKVILNWACKNNFNIQCGGKLYCELPTNVKPLYWDDV